MPRPIIAKLLAALLLASCLVQSTWADKKPNVLLLIVDDLRAELGCYGDAHIHSPNIDRLAQEGLLLNNAYCQQAVCNPSRTSFLTGMRPESIGVLGNHTHFRTQHPDVTTLPQHFKNHGYHAAAIGKIYHGVFPEGASITKWDTMGDPPSWSQPAVRFGPRYYYTEEGIKAAKQVYQRIYQPTDPGPDDWTHKLVFGPATEAPDVADSVLYDGKVADAAIQTLQDLQKRDRPFFLSVGFIKPHSPYVAPRKYFELYPQAKLPDHTAFPLAAPNLAGHQSGELRRYTDQPGRGVIPDAHQRRVRQAYFACISFIDAQVGRVLRALDQTGLRDDTIVVLLSDHGYHLGEHGLWGKTTNFELDTRVPFIVRTPRMRSVGKTSQSLVELVDLFPTLAELAGLPTLPQLDGKSFVDLLDDADAITKTAAFSQYPRSGAMMGYSLRTSSHRLTRWVHTPSGEIRATELYDYTNGRVETANVADQFPEVVDRLTERLTIAFPRLTSARDTSQPANENDQCTGFEGLARGAFKSVRTDVGVWQADQGRSIIDPQHAKTGKQCLQLAGGPTSSVILSLADHIKRTGDLTFWAERWTRRTPFSFRIEKHTSAGWSEIYNGDERIQVGRSFLTRAHVPLRDKDIQQLRFTVTSPPNTGILLDDLCFETPQPQKIVRAEVVPLTLPALIGKPNIPILKVEIETTGQLNPLQLEEIVAALEDATGSEDVESMDVCLAIPGSKQQILCQRDISAVGPLKLTCDEAVKLQSGVNQLWIRCRLKRSANIDHRVAVSCRQLKFSNGQTVQLNPAPTIQRLGVAVRDAGDDGVHTFRIPGLVTTNQGTLIGVYDVRRRSRGDLPGDIDVGMSRSTDGGRTWEPMRVIMDMGEDPQWKYDGIGDPAVLVDRTTGTVWVAATWSHGNRSWFGSGPGLEPNETGQLMLVRSDDDGRTWSRPINITRQVKRPEWCFLLQGPGKGITMRDGTLVFAAQYQDPPENKRLPHSTIIYSKDHGKTWRVGTGAFDDTTESQVVEIEPGVLMLNCRYNRQPMRVVMTTRDLGRTWQKHPTSQRSLIEPGSCMASLIHPGQESRQDLGDWLLFSNPDSSRGRKRIMIKGSPDLGSTWPKQHRLLLDEENCAGYSCMTMIDDQTVGILYEGSQAHMTFQRIPLKEIIREPVKERRPAAKTKTGLRLPQVFGDRMVLQADARIPVWGTAEPSQEVTVTLGNQTRRTTADAKGLWQLRMPGRSASNDPILMTVKSRDQRIQFVNVLIGEVWVCAGQSNMEWPLLQSDGGKQEIAQADQPRLRLLHLVGGARGSSGSYNSQHLERLHVDTFCQGKWQVASSASARNFSAVAWYFGRHLQETLGVPVGLICPAVGGTPTEAWIPRRALEQDPKLKGLVAGHWLDNPRMGEFCRSRGQQNLLQAMQRGEKIPGDDLGPNHSFKPGFMWSAGIEPLIPYAIQGAIWYQGESNAETRQRAREHSHLFRTLVYQWRREWNQGDFSFCLRSITGHESTGMALVS